MMCDMLGTNEWLYMFHNLHLQPMPEQYSSGLGESIAAILVKSPDERPR